MHMESTHDPVRPVTFSGVALYCINRSREVDRVVLTHKMKTRMPQPIHRHTIHNTCPSYIFTSRHIEISISTELTRVNICLPSPLSALDMYTVIYCWQTSGIIFSLVSEQFLLVLDKWPSILVHVY